MISQWLSSLKKSKSSVSPSNNKHSAGPSVHLADCVWCGVKGHAANPHVVFMDFGRRSVGLSCDLCAECYKKVAEIEPELCKKLKKLKLEALQAEQSASSEGAVSPPS